MDLSQWLLQAANQAELTQAFDSPLSQALKVVLERVSPFLSAHAEVRRVECFLMRA